MSKDNLDMFKEQGMKKIRSIITNWFDWSIKQNDMEKQIKNNYIPKRFETKEEKEDRKKET